MGNRVSNAALYWGPTFLDQSHLLVEKFAIFVLYLETRGAKKIKLS